MKHFAKVLFLGAALMASVSVASATPISGSIGFGGTGTLTSSGVFTAGAANSAYVNVPGSGSLSGFTMFNPATFFSFTTGTTLGPIVPNQSVFTTTEGGVTLTFTLTGLTSAPAANGVGYGFAGTGTLSETGYTDTAATFTLNTNSAAGTFITFNTSAATPEPSSLILLGTGLVSAAGMLVRRRRIA